ncbi:O-antigen ligase family protein [Salinibacter ruber]|uniref:O-antigen ligase family protein n=1 Tax=Salinibacter ruber TaxID=146919 RepID=UPI003C6E580F
MFWVIDVATIPLILYSIYLIWSGTTSVSAIPILFLLIICYHLVRWHAGSTWGVVVASIFCITNILVGARTPGGIGLGLYLLIEMMLGGRRRWLRIVVIGILLGIATVAVWLTYPPLRDTFLGGDSGLTFGSVAINTSGRIYMWQLTLESYMSSPWLGLGVDAPPEILYARGQHHPHNDYLRILHHLGATGLLLWLLFYGRLMNRVWGAWKRLRHTLRESEHAQLFGTTFMAMVAAGLTMLTDNTIVYSFVMYPLALLIGSSIGVLSAK